VARKFIPLDCACEIVGDAIVHQIDGQSREELKRFKTPRVQSATRAIQNAARAGLVSMWGRKVTRMGDCNQPVPLSPTAIEIPQADWLTLAIDHASGFASEPFSGEPVYGELQLDRNEIDSLKSKWAELARLAPAEPDPAANRRATIAAETECETWLAEQMRQGPPKMSKANYKNDCQERFGVGSRAFERAWANAVKQTGSTGWTKPGRKSIR
jgi:hypothetical protein